MSFRSHSGLSQPKKVLILFGLLIIISGVFGLVYAYFTSSDVAQALTFQAANLAIEISDPDKTDNQPLLPGDTQSATWEIKNTGNVAENFKMKFEKNLLDGGAIESLQITQIAYEDNGNWISWVVNASGINQEIYWSDNGENSNLKPLPAGEKLKIKVSFKLDENTPDEMQNKSWEIKLHVAAKQVNTSAEWPVGY